MPDHGRVYNVFLHVAIFSSILLIGQFWRKTGRLRPFQRRYYAIFSKGILLSWDESFHLFFKLCVEQVEYHKT